MNPLIHKNKKLIIGVGSAAVLILLFGMRWFFSYSTYTPASKKAESTAGEKSAAKPAVQAFKVAQVNFIDNLVLTGNLQGGARIELRFNRDGRIEKLNYRTGEKVKAGDIIAALETGEEKIKLQQAEGELSQAVDLYRSGAIAKPKLTQSQLAAQLARQEYKRSFLKAPRDGSIGELNTEVGEFVNTQLTIATLVSVEQVYVEMGVIEKDLSKLHLDQTVRVKVQTYPDVKFEGKISHISPTVEGQSRTRTVRAKIDNAQGLLLPGMFAQVEIFVREKPDALVIPGPAIKISGSDADQKKEVFVINDKNQLLIQPIEVGYENADYSEVTKGLEPGMKIAAQLSDRLRTGLQVDIIEEIQYEAR